jgi:hypothetical protein
LPKTPPLLSDDHDGDYTAQQVVHSDVIRELLTDALPFLVMIIAGAFAVALVITFLFSFPLSRMQIHSNVVPLQAARQMAADTVTHSSVA